MKCEISLRKSVYFVSLIDRISSLRLRTGKPELIWCLSGWDKKSFSGAISVQNGFTNLLLVIPFCTEIVFPPLHPKIFAPFSEQKVTSRCQKKWSQNIQKSGPKVSNKSDPKVSQKVVSKCPKKCPQSDQKSVPKVTSQNLQKGTPFCTDFVPEHLLLVQILY